MDSGILTNLLVTFQRVFSLGFASILPEARHLLAVLATIEITLAAIWWALDGGTRIEIEFLRKIILIGFFVFVVNEYEWLVETVLNGFIYVGERAGGHQSSFLTDPSRIIDCGLEATEKLFEHLSNISRFEVWKLGEVIILGLTGLLILLSYFALAITSFITLIEFYIIAVLGLILIPFGVFKHTAFLSERVFGAIIAFGIRLMVLAFILGIIEPILVTYRLSADPSINEIFSLLAATFTITVLAWHAPSIASGLMVGSPSLGAGAVAGTGLALAGGVAVTGGAAAGAVRSIAHAGHAATKAAAGAISHHNAPPKGGGGGSAGGTGALVAPSGGRSLAGSQKSDVTSSSNFSGRPAWAEKILMARGAIPQDSHPSGGVHVPIRHE